MSDPKLCTLIELQTVYSLSDLADMHTALDELDAMRREAVKR